MDAASIDGVPQPEPDGGTGPDVRRWMRDMAALHALPALWVDHEPNEIAAGLLSVLFGVLELDGAYARFEDPRDGGPPLETWRPSGAEPPAEVRIGVVGSPRVEKRTREFLEGAAASSGNFQLVCWSLSPGETAPTSPRIAVAKAYERSDDRTYALRLAACDALALPVDPDGEMLGSGVVADAIGAGLAVLGSDWGYLRETLGEALIPCGHTAASVRAALDALDPGQVAAARAAAAALRPSHDWNTLATRTADLFDGLLTDP